MITMATIRVISRLDLAVLTKMTVWAMMTVTIQGGFQGYYKGYTVRDWCCKGDCVEVFVRRAWRLACLLKIARVLWPQG